MFKEWGEYGDAFAEDVPYEEVLPEYTKENWEIGFGLQAVDGLKPSKYLVELANKQVAGEISYERLEADLKEYHNSNTDPRISAEADFSSMRIAEILATNNFILKPHILLQYHKHLFSDIRDWHFPVGQYRRENISKAERVLNGETVVYKDYRQIAETLEYDFEQERLKRYKGLDDADTAHSAMQFISNVWEVHAFREGNTRTIAVLAIQHFRQLGFSINNEPFKEHAKYFRDALALANAPRKWQTDKYLRMFTENIVLGGKNELVIPK